MLWISLINKFSDISFSQCSVATCLRCGGMFNNRFIANFLQIVRVKNFKNRSVFDKVMPEILQTLFFPDTV